MTRPLWHWLLLLGQVAMWGSAFLLIKVAVAEAGPATVVAGRLVIAAGVLGAIVVVTRRRVPLTRRHVTYYVAIAVTGNCLPFWLIAWGEQRVGAGLAGILMAVMPLTTLLLAHLFVAGERTNLAQIAGFLLGLLGLTILVGPDALAELRGTGTVFWAELALVGAAMSYATCAVVSRNRPPGDPLGAATGTMVVAAAIIVPA